MDQGQGEWRSYVGYTTVPLANHWASRVPSERSWPTEPFWEANATPQTGPFSPRVASPCGQGGVTAYVVDSHIAVGPASLPGALTFAPEAFAIKPEAPLLCHPSLALVVFLELGDEHTAQLREASRPAGDHGHDPLTIGDAQRHDCVVVRDGPFKLCRELVAVEHGREQVHVVGSHRRAREDHASVLSTTRAQTN